MQIERAGGFVLDGGHEEGGKWPIGGGEEHVRGICSPFKGGSEQVGAVGERKHLSPCATNTKSYYPKPLTLPSPPCPQTLSAEIVVALEGTNEFGDTFAAR